MSCLRESRVKICKERQCQLCQSDISDWQHDGLPCRHSGETFVENDRFSAWAKKASAISCEEIGEANEKQKRGVIIASFNAG